MTSTAPTLRSGGTTEERCMQIREMQLTCHHHLAAANVVDESRIRGVHLVESLFGGVLRGNTIRGNRPERF